MLMRAFVDVPLAPCDLIGVVELGQPGRAVLVAALDRLERGLVGLERGIDGDGHVGRHDILPIAQDAEAAGEVGVQLEAAELEFGRAAADGDAQRSQRVPQLLAELVAQRALGQVEFALQVGEEVEHGLLLAGLECGQRPCPAAPRPPVRRAARCALLERGDQAWRGS